MKEFGGDQEVFFVACFLYVLYVLNLIFHFHICFREMSTVQLRKLHLKMRKQSFLGMKLMPSSL